MPARRALEGITRTTRDHRDRTWRGFNLSSTPDLQAILAVLRGEHQISGLTNRRLQEVLPKKNAGQIGRILKRLRLHGLIHRIGKAMKEGWLKELTQADEQTTAQVRARVEHPFHIVKNLFRDRKVRYRGLAKNTAQLHTLFALANLVIAKVALLKTARV